MVSEGEIMEDKRAKLDLATTKITEYLRQQHLIRYRKRPAGSLGANPDGADVDAASSASVDVLDEIQRALSEFDNPQVQQASSSSSTATSDFFEGEILSGHSNYTYKLSVKEGTNIEKNDDDQEDDDDDDVPSNNKLSLFAKVALTYAVWNPDRTAKFDLQRLSNEMYMMKYMNFVVRQLASLRKQKEKQKQDTMSMIVDDDPVHGYLLDVDEFDFGSTTKTTTTTTDDDDVDVFVPVCQPYFILDLDDTARCLVNHFETNSTTWHAHFIDYVHENDKPKMELMLRHAAKFISLVNLQPISSSSPEEPMMTVAASAAGAAVNTGMDKTSQQQRPYGPFHPNYNDGVREAFFKVGPFFKSLFGLLIANQNPAAVGDHDDKKSSSTSSAPPLPDVKTVVPSLFTSHDRRQRQEGEETGAGGTSSTSSLSTEYNQHFIDYAHTTIGQETFNNMVDKMMECYANRHVVLHGDFHVLNILVPNAAADGSSSAAPSSQVPPQSAFRVCDWDMSHVGDYGRDMGSFFAFPVACSYFLASQPGRKNDAYALLGHLSLVWTEYSRLMSIHFKNKSVSVVGDSENTDDDLEAYLTKVYRSTLGWFGMYSLCANVLLNLQMDHFPFDRVSEGMGVMVMSSFSLTGLKALNVGFLSQSQVTATATTTIVDDSSFEHLDSLTKWFHGTVSEQIEFLASKSSSETKSSKQQ